MLRDPIWPDDLSARQALIQTLEQRRELRASKPLPPVARSVGTCTAVDEETGKRCTLPAHGAGDHSASGRRFKRSLQPGAQPRRELDGFAIARLGNDANSSSAYSGGIARTPAYQKTWREKKEADVAKARLALSAKRELQKAQDAAVEQLVAAPAEGAAS